MTASKNDFANKVLLEFFKRFIKIYKVRSNCKMAVLKGHIDM